MLRACLITISALSVLCALAQPEPQFTQYMYNRYLYNPAYAGSSDELEFSLMHRSQYVGLADQAIASEGFNFSLPVPSISSGVGVNAINDFIGYTRSTYVDITYDYRKNFTWGKLGIGVSGGIIQTSLDGSKLRTPQGDYTSGEINPNDPFIPTTLQQGLSPDLGLGVYLNNNKYFAGFTANHLIMSTVEFNSPTNKVYFNFARELMLMGGYDFTISKGLHCMPSAIVKTDLTEVQTDVSATFTIINNILTGISFRGYDNLSVDALALMVGIRYKGFQAVYSYDANLSFLTNFNSGSHEISVSYKLPLRKKENHGYFYNNPRFN